MVRVAPMMIKEQYFIYQNYIYIYIPILNTKFKYAIRN